MTRLSTSIYRASGDRSTLIHRSLLVYLTFVSKRKSLSFERLFLLLLHEKLTARPSYSAVGLPELRWGSGPSGR